MFEMIVLTAIVAVVVGVVLEHHFFLYDRVALALRSWWDDLAEFWRRFMRSWLFMGWRAWEVAIMLLIFAFAALVAMAFTALLVLLVMGLPEIPKMSIGPIAFFTAIAAIFTALLGWVIALWSSLISLLKSVGAAVGTVIVFLVTNIPSCERETPPAAMEAVTPAVELTVPLEVPLVLTTHKGEGCIAITRRGGHELTLPQCIKLAQTARAKIIRNARGYTEAPRVFMANTFTYHKGAWTYK